MLDVGLSEILLIAIVTIIFVGPEDLPKLMRTVGRYYGKLRRASEELRSAFQLEVDRVEADRRADEIRRRREELLAKRRAQAQPGGPTPRTDEAPAPDAAPPPKAEAPIAVPLTPPAPATPAAESGPTPDAPAPSWIFPRGDDEAPATPAPADPSSTP